MFCSFFVIFGKNYKKLITDILIYIIIFNKHFHVAMASFKAKSAANVPVHTVDDTIRPPCPQGEGCEVLDTGQRCSNYHPPTHIVCKFDGRCKNESCKFRHAKGKAEPAAAAAEAPSTPVERPRNKEYPAPKPRAAAEDPSALVERSRNKEYPAPKPRAAPKQQNAAIPHIPSNLNEYPPFAGPMRLTLKVSADGKSWEITYT